MDFNNTWLKRNHIKLFFWQEGIFSNKNKIYKIHDIYFIFPTTKGYVNACMELVGLSTFNNVKNHWSTECHSKYFARITRIEKYFLFVFYTKKKNIQFTSLMTHIYNKLNRFNPLYLFFHELIMIKKTVSDII